MIDLRKLKKTLISKMQLKELNLTKGSLNILAIGPRQDPRKTIGSFIQAMREEEGILTPRWGTPYDSAYIDSESYGDLHAYTGIAILKENHAAISAAVIPFDYFDPLPDRSLVQIRITDKPITDKYIKGWYFDNNGRPRKKDTFYEQGDQDDEDLW